MNIKELLNKEHSKRNTLAIVNYIGNDPLLFKELIDLIQSKDYRTVQRASWPLSLVVEKHPQLVYPYLNTLLKLLTTSAHPAYKRNVFRLLRNMDTIPEKYHTHIINACMQSITNQNDAPTIRAFAIHIMSKMASIYPDLANELAVLLEPLTNHNLPSLKSSSKKVLKQISKKLI